MLDPRLQGLSGAQEVGAIAALTPFAEADAADLCHQVLMRVLPGAADGDFAPFAAGINRVQQRLGAHFAPAQGGSPWTSAAVGRLLQWLRAQAGDQAAIGQSSWGPTGFAIVPSSGRRIAVLVPPIDGEQASLLALLADGAAWSTSALALALGASQRTVQRALAELEAAQRVRAIGRARAQRWLSPPLAGFTTILLLPTALSLA